MEIEQYGYLKVFYIAKNVCLLSELYVKLKKSMRFIIYLLSALIWLRVGLCMYAQTVNPEYWDGRIFLKIKNESVVKLPNYTYGDKTNNYPVLETLFDEFGISKVFRPFTLLNTLTFANTYEVQFTKVADVDELIRNLNKDDLVEYAEKIPLERTEYSPNDPNANDTYQWYLTKIKAYQAWDLNKGSSGVVVAVVDDAVKITHEDLQSKLWVNPSEIANNNFDDDGNGFVDDINGFDLADNDKDPSPPNTATAATFSHGTHVAGIAAGATDNALGIASIGYNIRVMSLKCVQDASTDPTIIQYGWQGIQYAITKHADVINISWGGSSSAQTYQNIINAANSQGTVVVAAAGNANTSNTFYPAGYTNVIAVGATGTADEKASYSNYGTWVKVSAPGNSIRSCVATANNTYASKSGTSMATPVVAGLCALIKSYNGSLTADAIRSCIYTTADNIDAINPSYAGQLGTGRVNAQAALICAAPLSCAIPTNLSYSNLTQTSVTLNWTAIGSATNYTIQIKPTNTTNWSTFTTTSNFYVYNGISNCTSYDFKVKTNCSGNTSSNYSTISTFVSPSNGPSSYCTSKGSTGNFEWISKVVLAGTTHNSGMDLGYGDYTCFTFDLNASSVYSIAITPSYASQAYTEHFKAWIDYNQDGDFTDSNEEIFATTTPQNTMVSGSFTVPASAIDGTTRMRIAQKWVGAGDTGSPTPCMTFAYGEVQDYSVNITNNSATVICSNPDPLPTTNISQVGATINWTSDINAISYTVQYKASTSSTWATISNITNNYLVITGLISGINYQFQVKSQCDAATFSNYSAIGYFTTNAISCAIPAGLVVGSITASDAFISWNGVASSSTYNLKYKPTASTAWTLTSTTLTSKSITNLNAGTLYEVQIQSDCGSTQSNYSSSVNFTTLVGTTCGTPTNLAATGITTTSATLSWTAVASATGYTINYKPTTSTAWTSTTSTITSKAITVVAGTSYDFKVSATCTGGIGAFSNSSSFITPASCGTPINLTSSSITTTTATLSWAAVTSATSYTINYKPSNTTAWITTTSTTLTKAISGLISGTAYDFKVNATCSAATGAFSSTATFTTLATCNIPTGLTSSNVASTSATVNCMAVSGAVSYSIQYRKVATTAWTQVNANPTTSYIITGLLAATNYEFQYKTNCSGSNSSDYSASATFTTTNLPPCNIPSGHTVTTLMNSQATLNWLAISGAASYQVQYRPTATTAWTIVNTTTNFYTALNLIACTNYEFQVKTVCSANNESAFSASYNFTTTGCGLTYCESKTTNSSKEWIANVTINTINNTTISNSGYGNFTNLSTNLTVEDSYNIALTPDFLSASYNEFWRVWIDYNKDGDFSDIGELVVDNFTSGEVTLNSTITIPATASTGSTRMRVAMKYKGTTATAPNPCDVYTYGEVEDYAVNILAKIAPITYCAVKANNATKEWIARVTLYTMDNQTASNGGYADFTTLSTNLNAGIPYTLSLTPGFAATQYNEMWKVWIDLNQDGDFADVNETIFTSATASKEAVSTLITIPVTAYNGSTRMRIAMRYNALADPCTNYSYGEIEDYTVNIIGATTADAHEEAFIEEYSIQDETEQDYGNKIVKNKECDIKASFNYEVDGKSISFVNTSTGHFNTVYWIFGENKIMNTENPTFNFKEDGEHQFSFTISDSETGCSDIFEGSVRIFDDTTTEDTKFIGR